MIRIPDRWQSDRTVYQSEIVTTIAQAVVEAHRERSWEGGLAAIPIDIPMCLPDTSRKGDLRRTAVGSSTKARVSTPRKTSPW